MFNISKADAGLYALEKFEEAVRALDGAGDNLRDGLYEAALYILRVRPDEVPDELRPALVELLHDLTAAESSGSEGKLVATLRGMSECDVAALAARVRALKLRLQRVVG